MASCWGVPKIIASISKPFVLMYMWTAYFLGDAICEQLGDGVVGLGICKLSTQTTDHDTDVFSDKILG